MLLAALRLRSRTFVATAVVVLSWCNPMEAISTVSQALATSQGHEAHTRSEADIGASESPQLRPPWKAVARSAEMSGLPLRAP